MLTFAVALNDKGVPVPDIAKKLTIKVGKNAGTSPSSPRSTGHSRKPGPPRPKPTRIRQPEDPLTAEEAELRERFQAQPHPNAETRS
ncbi:hypothetical protein [Streptomyces flaveolus]|uniref:hypothetical protein n=1 Tax=Streptomyces flaveolus TaxID=67297 RepID=UPI00331AFF98